MVPSSPRRAVAGLHPEGSGPVRLGLGTSGSGVGRRAEARAQGRRLRHLDSKSLTAVATWHQWAVFPMPPADPRLPFPKIVLAPCQRDFAVRLWVNGPALDDFAVPVVSLLAVPDSPASGSVHGVPALPVTSATNRLDLSRTHVNRLGKRIGGNPLKSSNLLSSAATPTRHNAMDTTIRCRTRTRLVRSHILSPILGPPARRIDPRARPQPETPRQQAGPGPGREAGSETFRL